VPARAPVDSTVGVFFLKSGNPEILSLYSQKGSLSHLFQVYVLK